VADEGDEPEKAPPKVVVPFPLEGTVGAGDVVRRVTSALGVSTCSACEQRRRRMNRWVGFGRRRRR